MSKKINRSHKTALTLLNDMYTALRDEDDWDYKDFEEFKKEWKREVKHYFGNLTDEETQMMRE